MCKESTTPFFSFILKRLFVLYQQMVFLKESLIKYYLQEGVAMNVTTKLKMDLSKPDFGLSMDAVQGDSYTRSVSIALYSKLQPWKIPEGVTAAIRYAKPDHTKGYYDTLPNGESAWCHQDNMLTIHLAPQMLTVAGNVEAQIELIQGTHILSTFCLIVHVEPNPAAGVTKSEDYVNWLQWIQEQSDLYVLQVQQAAQLSSQSAQTASQAAENAAVSANSANISAKNAVDATISANSIQKETASLAAEVSAIVAGNEAYTKHESNSRYSPVITQIAAGKNIVASTSTNAPLQNLKLFGKTVQNGTPTPEAPVPLESVGKSVNVTICGKNLVDVFNENMSVMRDGKTATSYPNIVNDDGSLTINVSGSISYGQGFKKSLCAGQTVTISYIVDGFGNGTGLRFRIFDTNDYSSSKVQQNITVSGKFTYTFTPTVDSVYLFGWYVSGGSEMPCGAKVHDLQLEFASVATEYEPYKNGGSVLVATPNGLPGISVTSGGNYTDESGHQWVCDEVDFEKGVHIQRVKSIKLADMSGGHNGKNFWFTSTSDKKLGLRNLLSTHYPVAVGTDGLARRCIGSTSEPYLYIYDDQYSSVSELKSAYGDAVFLYEIATPIETALPAEELAQYATLHTNYPNTTVFNDGGAGMEVKYVADTKLYIDQKFDQLAAALVKNV